MQRMKSKIRKSKKQYEDLEEIAYEASMKANYNEQYSRKILKFMG